MQECRANALLTTAAVAVMFKNSSYFILFSNLLSCCTKMLLGFVCWIHAGCITIIILH